MSLRIFYLIPHVNIAGGNKVVFEQANRLADKGYRVFILTDEGEPPGWIATKAEIARKDIWAGRLEQQDILIFTWDYDVDYVLKQECRRFYLIQHFIHPLEQKIKHLLDGFLSVSKWIQEHTLREYGVDSFLVPNGVDHEVFYPRKNIERETAYILAIDWRNGPEWKGFVDIEESIRIVKETLPNVRFAAVRGQTPLEMAEHYSRASVYVSGSWYEGFGLPLLEAMACGCPVVTTDNKGSGEFAIDGKTCLKVPVHNPEAMADAILRLLDDKILRQKLIVNGLKMAQRYKWDKSIDILEYALGLTKKLPDNELAPLQPSREMIQEKKINIEEVKNAEELVLRECQKYRLQHKQNRIMDKIKGKIKKFGRRVIKAFS